MEPLDLGNRPQLLRRVAGHGLPGSPPVAELPLCPEEWQRLASEVRSQRLDGLLAQAIADGALPVTTEQRAEAAERHRLAIGPALGLERWLQVVHRRLDAARVEHRLSKGPAFAHLDYPDPAQRVFADLDVLVPSAQIESAKAALSACGHRRLLPELRQSFDARFAKSVTMRAVHGPELDLHRRLALEPPGLFIDEADLFASPETLRLGASLVPVPPRPVRFLHACYHAALGDTPPRLLPLRDVAQLGLALDDVSQALATAERWQGRVFVAAAVATAWQAFDLEEHELAAWARGYCASDREQRMLAPFLSPRRRQVPRTLATLRTLPGLTDRARYVGAIALPGRTWREARGVDARGWWRRGWTALRTGGTG